MKRSTALAKSSSSFDAVIRLAARRGSEFKPSAASVARDARGRVP
jgi:hypothetical protein